MVAITATNHQRRSTVDVTRVVAATGQQRRVVHTPTQTVALVGLRRGEHTIQSALREDLRIAVKTVDCRANTYQIIGRRHQTTARIQTLHILAISVVATRRIEYALHRQTICLGVRTNLNGVSTCGLGNLLLHIVLVLHTRNLLDHATQDTVTQVRVVVFRTRLIAELIAFQSVLDGLLRSHTIGSRREHRVVRIEIVVPAILMFQEVANRNLLITSLDLGEVLSQNTTLSKRLIGQRELAIVDQSLNRHRAEGLRNTRQTQHMTTIHTLAVLLVGITVTARIDQLTLIGNRHRHTRQVVVLHKLQHLLIESINAIANIDIVEFLLTILSRYRKVEQLRSIDLRFARNDLVSRCAERNLCSLRNLEIEDHLANVVTNGDGDIIGIRKQKTGANRRQTRIFRRRNRNRGYLLARLGN